MSQTLQHPFRLFFPLTCLAVLVALLPWFSLNFAPQYAGHFPLHWHAFTFIQLTGGAAFAGFLLTALPSWCSWRPNFMPHTLALFGLWTAALVTLPWANISGVIICLFWLYLLLLAARLIIRTHTWRQSAFLYILALILATAIGYALTHQARWLHSSVDIMIVAVAMANFRVGRVIGNQALEDGQRDDEQFMPNPYYKNISCIVLSIAALCSLFASQHIQGWLYLAAGMSFAARLNDWHHRRLLRFAYVRAHYAVSLSMALGYSALGYALLAAPQWFSFVRHYLAIAVYLLMIITIMSIAGLRHSGKKLHFYPDTRLAMALLIAAAISRAVLAYIQPGMNTLYLYPTLAISAAFILYAVRYLIIFRHNAPH
ncbi:NnrS family protein [Cardiobacteriaceae bacterium TAE3-ERU3]|nr:NnrS family protein [Cardiobacteriaceae bacterium TAE3-ERU3]